MKRLHASLGIALLAAVSISMEGCSSSPNRDAPKLAQNYWDRRLTKCGESYYDFRESGLIREYKGVSWTLEVATISREDEANGFTWKGMIVLDCTNQREYSQGRWGPWIGHKTIAGLHAPAAAVELYKRYELWFYDDQEVHLYRPKKRDCSTVPP